MSDHPTPVTLFADFTCPFCYVTESGLRRIAATRPMELRPRAYELFPAPSPAPIPAQDRSELEAGRALAADLGLTLQAPELRPRTRKAHEAALFAAAVGSGAEMRAAIYRAYWQEGRDIGRIDVLMELATEVGADPTELKIALDIDRFSDEVAAHADLARRLRVTVVPTLFVGTGPGARIVQGARELAALDAALAAG